MCVCVCVCVVVTKIIGPSCYPAFYFKYFTTSFQISRHGSIHPDNLLNDDTITIITSNLFLLNIRQ